MKRFLFLTLIASMMLFVWSCSESVQPETHGDYWMNTSNADFHGQALALRGWDGLESCRTCHGGFLDGGDSGVSCAQCHEGGPSGHPAPIDHLTSGTELFHGFNMDPAGSANQAEECWQCHSLNTDGPVAMGCDQCHGPDSPIF